MDLPNKLGLCIWGVVLEPFRDAISPRKVALLSVRDGVADSQNLGVGPKLDRIRNCRGSPRRDRSRGRGRMSEFLVKVAGSRYFGTADGCIVLFLTKVLVRVGVVVAVAVVKANVA